MNQEQEDRGLKTYDYSALNRQLDRVKSNVFSRKGASFFGPLMSSMEFSWDTGIETACTDSVRIWWNPDFFLDGPTLYGAKGFNDFVMRHELWHPARLHMLRMGERDSKLWNYACDVRINNDLKYEGYDWGSFGAWFMPELDADGIAVEEDIYDKLFNRGFIVPANPWGNDEFVKADPNAKQKTINNVVRSIINANMEDKPDDIPGNTQKLVDHFLAPQIPWEKQLAKWFTDLINNRISWRRPRRRLMTHNMYLPSRLIDEDRLAHLVYMQDVSGSISEQEIVIFNSELKYVWDMLKPKKMTVVQFDTIIQKVDEFKHGDEFARIEIIGRGGNDMNCVADFLEELETPPTGVVIFADMEFSPMRKLKIDVPVLWVASKGKVTPPYGDLITLKIKNSRPLM